MREELKDSYEALKAVVVKEEQATEEKRKNSVTH